MDNRVIQSIHKLTKHRRLTIFTITSLWIGTVFGFALLFGLFGIWLAGAMGGIFATVAALVLGGVACWVFSLRHLLARVSSKTVAIDVEDRQPELKSRLLSAYELASAKTGPGLSRGLTSAFVSDVSQRFSKISAPLPRSVSLFAYFGFSTTFIIWLLLFFAFPGFLAERFIELGEVSAAITGKTILRVEPGDTTVGTNRDIEIEIHTAKDIIGPVYVITNRNGNTNKIETDFQENGKYATTINSTNNDFDYHIEAADDVSRTYNVTVKPPPTITTFRIIVYPPVYTGLPPVELPAGTGDVTGYPGSKISVVAECTDVESMELSVKGEEPEQISGVDGRFAFDFTLNKTGAYKLNAVSEWGETSTPYFRLTANVDYTPIVKITEPTGNLEIADPYPSPRLTFNAEDDFGITAARVHYYNETTGQTYTTEIIIPRGRKAEASGDLITPDLDLFPGDIISYFVEVYDNDTVNGPKVGRSKTQKIRFPTMAEVFEDMNEGLEETGDDLAGIKEQMREFDKDIDNTFDDDANRPERSEMRELLQNQQQMRGELSEIAEDLEEMLAKAEEGLISPELAQKMWQVNELMNKVLDEETREIMEKLKEAMAEVDPERLAELMKDIKLDQEQLEANMDRMMALLEEVRRDQMLSEMAYRARELADRQELILNDAQKSETLDELAVDEMNLSDDIASLENDISELADDFTEADPDTANDITELAQETAEKQIPEKAATTAKSMNAGDMKKAEKSGSEVAEDLKELASSLDQMQQEYRESQKQQMMADITALANKLLLVSFRMEDFAYEAYLNPRASLAEREVYAVSILPQLSKELRDLSATSFFIQPQLADAVDDAYNLAIAAADNLTLGNNKLATENNTKAMAQLNLVVYELLKANENIANSSSSMGLAEMMEQMKGMAESQSQLNQQGENAMQMMPGMKPGDLQQMLEAMAARQAEIRRQMQQMQSESGGKHSEMLGDVGTMIDEMKELEEMLRRGEMNDKVNEKQEKLLERMLKTHRAMRNKGKSSKRRSEIAREYKPVGVPSSLPSRLTVPRSASVPAGSSGNADYIAPEYSDATSDYFRRLAGY